VLYSQGRLEAERGLFVSAEIWLQKDITF